MGETDYMAWQESQASATPKAVAPSWQAPQDLPLSISSMVAKFLPRSALYRSG